MRRFLKIKTRTFSAYVVIMLIFMLLFSVGTTAYVTWQKGQEYLDNVEYECKVMAADFTSLYTDVERLSTFLLSDVDVLSAIHYLSKPLGQQDTFVRNRHRDNLRAALYSYYVTQYYHRVSYINLNGTLITSDHKNLTMDTEDVKQRLENFYQKSWEKKLVFLGSYEDVWEDGEHIQVTGLVKKIYGENKGFFEIQMNRNDFEEIFQREFPVHTDIAAVLNGKEIYSSSSKSSDWQLDEKEGVSFQKGKLITCQTFGIRGEKLALYGIVPVSEVISGMWGAYLGIFCFMMLLVFMTFLFLYFYLGKLVVPINDLKEQMDRTSIENLPELKELPESEAELEELVSLHRGYNRLIHRIREGREREQKLAELQLRTHFDALQAQINPHFINNTLNVISYRGTVLGDDEICEVCNHLSAMLKFSTGTKRRVVTIKEELEYVESYMELLKYRYRESFQYEIRIEREIYEQKIPKIVIQQLVENSISHGYRTPYQKIHIQVIGWVENGWWHIKVQDNGDGFEKSVLVHLSEETARVKEKILEKHEIQDMDIGGMGLLNIYSRFLLIHDSDFDMNFYNDEDGAVVILSSVMERSEQHD